MKFGSFGKRKMTKIFTIRDIFFTVRALCHSSLPGCKNFFHSATLILFVQMCNFCFACWWSLFCRWSSENDKEKIAHLVTRAVVHLKVEQGYFTTFVVLTLRRSMRWCKKYKQLQRLKLSRGKNTAKITRAQGLKKLLRRRGFAGNYQESRVRNRLRLFSANT